VAESKKSHNTPLHVTESRCRGATVAKSGCSIPQSTKTIPPAGELQAQQKTEAPSQAKPAVSEFKERSEYGGPDQIVVRPVTPLSSIT
jgi:hypothetical protein